MASKRILRRDDINPPEEPFPAEEEDGRSGPWIPEGMADPGISPTSDVHRSEAATKIYQKEAKPKEPKSKRPTFADEETESAPAPRPWIPDAISAAARIRGRALVFLVAAIGTLMIAVGVFRIQNRVAEIEEKRKPIHVEPMSEFAPSRGIPIEIIEDKVRRMRPAPGPNRR